MQQPLAVTIIGGYLGAGKTTLVNHLLRHADGQRLAVLVNEFGELPIDEDLIEARTEDLIAIAGGCVCCSFGSDLTAALTAMAQRSPTPDHVIIESSGVAMPGAIAANIGLMQYYLLAGVVVLADSETIQAHARDEYIGDTVTRQLADADLIVQTKSDLVSRTQRERLRQWFISHHPEARFVHAEQGNVPGAVILGHFTNPNPAVRERSGFSPHSDAQYHSEVIEIADRCNVEALGKTLAQGNIGILRAKGYVLDQKGQTTLLQVVGRRFVVVPYQARVKPQLVFIGLRGGFTRSGLEQAIQSSQ